MELIKQPVIKESPSFPTFSILSDCCMRVFLSFVIKAFAKFKKLIRFHRHQAYIICKIGLILKILTEIICQKLLVSNAILAIQTIHCCILYMYSKRQTTCLPSYYQFANGLMASRGLGDMTFHTLLVPMNQRLLKKSSKEHNKFGQKQLMTCRVLKSHRNKT